MNYFAVLILLGLCACGGVDQKQLSATGVEVKVLLNKAEKGCSVLEKVVGTNDNGSQDLAENHARNLAAKLRANAIYFNEVVQTGGTIKVYGTAYSCK